jgi:hypothetical protein
MSSKSLAILAIVAALPAAVSGLAKAFSVSFIAAQT